MTTEDELSARWRDWDRLPAATYTAWPLEATVQAFCAERGLAPSAFRQDVTERRRAGEALESAIAAAAGNE